MHKTLAFSLSLLFAGCTAVPAPQDDAGSTPAKKERGALNPVTQPTLFESPTIQGEVRPIFIHHRFTSETIGGDLQLYALQLRVPITDKLAFIATKDGYIDFNSDALPRDEGFADIAGGLKLAVIERKDLTVTPGLIYETTTGDEEVLQGNGDGVLRPFVSFGMSIREDIQLLGNVGFNWALDDAESQSIDYHLHCGWMLHEHVMPLVELHGITYTKSGEGLPVNFEGYDVVNLGATNVDGQTVISAAVGARIPVTDTVDIGAAFEFPLGGRQDILEDRVTIDATIRF